MAQPRKLDDDQVQVIIACLRLRDRVMEECSSAALARKYGVSRALIHKISVHGKWWREHEKLVQSGVVRGNQPMGVETYAGGGER